MTDKDEPLQNMQQLDDMPWEKCCQWDASEEPQYPNMCYEDGHESNCKNGRFIPEAEARALWSIKKECELRGKVGFK